MCSDNVRLIAGVDEAGRGPLAGNVVAAAVILNPDAPIDGLRDSKTLSASKRETLAQVIRERVLSFCVAEASVEEIDTLNILQATMLAMQRAVQGLNVAPQEAWIDGNRAPMLSCVTRTIIKGDRDIAAISAASILAKTVRDVQMLALDRLYPEYGFAKHKGYGTAQHLEAIRRLGPCPQHRRSFAPMKNDSFSF